MNKISSIPLSWLALAGSSVILAAHPVMWLVQSWISPAYGSYGYLYVLLIMGLAWVSLRSGRPTVGTGRTPVLALLFLAALIRLLGQMMAVNILSALALTVDVFALTLLLRLNLRPFALSPVWMAALFLFALPTEVVLQRTLGFPLQMISASLSCMMLKGVFPDVLCEGVRITLDQRDILVDLPCSGASGLLLALAFVVTQNAIMRPRWQTACLALLAVAGFAALGNSLRISLLAIGLVNDLNVMAEPLHSLIGLTTLCLTILPFALFYRPRSRNVQRAPINSGIVPKYASWPVGFACLGASLAIVSLSPDPVDVSGTVESPALPSQIHGFLAREVPLEPLEVAYFETYGGAAKKARFGPLGVNVVSTRAPLRHLHAPEICLRGLGYKVRFLGTRHEGTPSAYYQAIGPDGDIWRVAVSYVSQSGQVTPSVGEAIWLWLIGTGGTWSSVQRITPWTLDPGLTAELNAAALVAMDIQKNEGTDI
ncbi:exosortase T [Ruegeria sp. 6PALISEP08]|uniref:exosortase T n=1 Tax=Ruegeria sp. 6PALISEP08 TaxID=1225660 RepID=UPI00067E903E|nr:exosortase T [Ruegeria sp. 6PALISEP08]